MSAALAVVACTGGGGATGVAGSSQSPELSITVGPDGIAQLMDDPDGPYGITAIDYHFHDAHPTIPLAPDRTVTVGNQGRNLHNITIPGTTYSRDVKPGKQIVIHAIGSLLGGPGRYRFLCGYHIDRGMTGTIVIAG